MPDPVFTYLLYLLDSPRNCSGMNTECTSSAVDMPTALITDPVEKCRRYESGDCMPQFNTDYTSIVTEVC